MSNVRAERLASAMPDYKTTPEKSSVAVSTVGHIAALFVILFGLPFVARDPEIIYQPIPIEIISASEIDDAPLEESAAPEPAPSMPLDEPPPMVEQPPQMLDEAPPSPQEQTRAPDPVPPPPSEAPPEAQATEPQRAAPLPIAKPRPPARPEPVEEQAAEEEEPARTLDSLLRNLAESDETPRVQQEQPAQQEAPSRQIGNVISLGEIDRLRQQIQGCWYFNIGAEYAERLVVELRVTMNPDRTVRSVNVSDSLRMSRDPAFRAAAEAAMRAIRNPNCSPLDLPPDKFNEWQYITLRFDPSGLL